MNNLLHVEEIVYLLGSHFTAGKVCLTH